MKYPIRVRATHENLVETYIIQPDPLGYYGLIIGTERCHRIHSYNEALERLDVEELAKATHAFKYYEYGPNMEGVTQEQRDKWFDFYNNTTVVVL